MPSEERVQAADELCVQGHIGERRQADGRREEPEPMCVICHIYYFNLEAALL